jgi:hypothetical protein
MSARYPEMSDAEKLGIRSGLAERVGALTRALWLGMYQARNDEERKRLAEIEATVTPPSEEARDERDATPLGMRQPPDPDQEAELVRLSSQEYLEYLDIFDDLVTRYILLRNAFHDGMVVTEGPEQEGQLAQLKEIMAESDGPA